MTDYQKTAVIDFDNTISGYDHWRGPEIMGPPIPYALNAILELREWGWKVVIFTTRGNKDSIANWLKKNNFPELLINSTEHNPPNTSHKPIAEVYFDDRDSHCVGEIPYNWHKAMKRVRKLYQPQLDTDIDDAAAWASWWNTYIEAPVNRRAFRESLAARLSIIEAFSKDA